MIFATRTVKGPELNVSGPALVLFFACMGIGAIATVTLRSPVWLVIAGAIGIYCLFAVKIVRQ